MATMFELMLRMLTARGYFGFGLFQPSGGAGASACVSGYR